MASIEIAFGKVLRELRTQKKMSQEALGFETDLSRNYISLLEKGEKSPSLRTIFKISQALKVDLSALLFLAEQEHQASS